MPTKQVVIVGTMTYPDDPTQPPQSPPHIWGGGNVPMPNPPIANVPGVGPNPDPPGFGNRPAHPIETPPPVEPPEGYHWEQKFQPPQPPGWEWKLVPDEGKKGE